MSLYTLVPSKDKFAYDAAVKPRVDVGYFLGKNLNAYPIVYPMFSPAPENSALDTDQALLDYLLTILRKQRIAFLPGDAVLFQLPSYSFNYRLEEVFASYLDSIGCYSLGLIHDVEYLRGFAAEPDGDLKLMNAMDGVILHSEAMGTKLEELGLKVPWVTRGPWDYHISEDTQNRRKITADAPLVYSGNLSEGKSKFLKEFTHKIDILGGMDPWVTNVVSTNPKVTFKGTETPDYLPTTLSEAGYQVGLLYDGNFSNFDSGYTSYLTYNWSHKVSAYLSAGLYVYAPSWSNAGKYLLDKGAGNVFNKLEDTAFTKEPGVNFAVKTLQSKIKRGYFITEAVQNLEEEISFNGK